MKLMSKEENGALKASSAPPNSTGKEVKNVKYEKPEVATLATAIDAVRGQNKFGSQVDSRTDPITHQPLGMVMAY